MTHLLTFRRHLPVRIAVCRPCVFRVRARRGVSSDQEIGQYAVEIMYKPAENSLWTLPMDNCFTLVGVSVVEVDVEAWYCPVHLLVDFRT